MVLSVTGTGTFALEMAVVIACVRAVARLLSILEAIDGAAASLSPSP